VSEVEGPYSRRLGEYVAGGSELVVPPDLVEHMKLLVLDTLGCALMARDLPWTQRLVETVAACEPPGPSRVWGRSLTASPANAAMVNGSAIHGFETDDIGCGGHCGSVSLPIAIALAEAGAPLSGMGLIRSIVTGIEVSARIDECLDGVPRIANGFHEASLIGTFTAACTGATVLGLDAQRSVYAIANAAQFTTGLMGFHHGGMSKRLLQGKAAHSGVIAAQLADHGFENVDNIFECGYGSFPESFSGGQKTYDLEKLTAGLGTEFRSYGVNFKMWSCRAPIHPTLEAIKAIRLEHPFIADDVEAIAITLDEGAHKAVGWVYTPSTITSAQLNLRYCAAVMVLFGEVFVNQFTEDLLDAPEVLGMIERISVHLARKEQDQRNAMAASSAVVVRLKDGTSLQATGAQRSPQDHPVSAEEVIDKFRRVTRGHLDESAQQSMVDTCLRLETLDAATDLLAPLHG
jgi:aconitate decarboxylase